MAQLRRACLQSVVMRQRLDLFRNRRVFSQACKLLKTNFFEIEDRNEALNFLRENLSVEIRGEGRTKGNSVQNTLGTSLSVLQFQKLIEVTEGENILTEKHFGSIVSSMIKKSPEHDACVIDFVLQDMEEKLGFRGNAFIFANLMQATRRNLAKTTQLWNEMQRRGITPNWSCYDAFIWAHIGAKRNEEAKELFEDLKSREKLGIGMYTTGMQIYLRLQEYSKARDLYKEMRHLNIEPDKESCLLAIQASVRQGNIERALQPYFEGVSLKIAPTTSQINVLLESIVDSCTQNEQLAATALRIFDQAHSSPQKVLNEQSFKLLIEIFYRINRKFTMDMMFMEASKLELLNPWSNSEDDTIDVSEMSHAVARASIRFVFNERLRAYIHFLEHKSRKDILHDPESDSDYEDEPSQMVNPSHDSLVLTPFGQFYSDVYVRVNKFNVEFVESVIHSVHTKLKPKKVKGDRNLLRIPGSQIEAWLLIAKKPLDFQETLKFEL